MYVRKSASQPIVPYGKGYSTVAYWECVTVHHEELVYQNEFITK